MQRIMQFWKNQLVPLWMRRFKTIISHPEGPYPYQKKHQSSNDDVKSTPQRDTNPVEDLRPIDRDIPEIVGKQIRQRKETERNIEKPGAAA